jgi:hypothetical protein
VSIICQEPLVASCILSIRIEEYNNEYPKYPKYPK